MSMGATRSNIMDTMKNMLANSAKFQEIVGAIDATAAKASIHIQILDDPKALRPWAIIQDAEFTGRKSGTGRTDSFRKGWLVFVTIERAVNAGVDIAIDMLAFTDEMDIVLSEILDQSGAGGSNSFNNYRLGPVATEEKKPESWQQRIEFSF